MTHPEPTVSGLVALPSGKSIFVQKYDAIPHDDPDIPIIFIHGFLGSTDMYLNIVPHLSNRTRILYDLEGHGSTPLPTTSPLTPASMAQVTHDLLTLYGYTRADVVAHSGGSFVALQFAQGFPGEVRKLVLLGPPEIPVNKDLVLGAARGLRVGSLEDRVPLFVDALGSRARDDPAILSRIRSEILLQDKDRAASTIEALSAFECAEGWGERGIEAVVVAGKQDTMATTENCAKLATRLGARLVEMDTGHSFTIEDPETTVKVLRDILG
ncbi:hypothetical protein PLICRDRAFT_46640 [Plicaturopsis crispa FD-325 SS-3]|uniref:Unplaced genomic scaffold PLICRscaffold_20, whole genome shotgun sequence n=1 Tax=Plicaturopsis crispa FD-325 SS-3 TaxID=944288 RepID=A0A0C9SWR9_PLICR|nr:hypothetical protein PLICRDRAFT_46640 [Plicaturopsis crispa FD-325 SS-3]